ncbi:hypothetical protein [Altererythrobacter sp. GH1-8]|uniref:hypothetical protein n=1 Tax=Altererythrobacter sp. GH1-8 TaxID=3349333 RepID=UPI00374DAFC2
MPRAPQFDPYSWAAFEAEKANRAYELPRGTKGRALANTFAVLMGAGVEPEPELNLGAVKLPPPDLLMGPR